MIEFDITELLIIFDELGAATNEELQYYWLNYSRPDEIKITLTLSKWEQNGVISITKDNNICFSRISYKDCNIIKVLDEEKKCLEVLCGEKESPTLRIFISLEGDNIIEVENL
jgi:hypothetical protein